MTFAGRPGIPWTGRCGPLVAEAAVLGALVVVDAVLAARAGPGELTTVAVEFAPGPVWTDCGPRNCWPARESRSRCTS